MTQATQRAESNQLSATAVPQSSKQQASRNDRLDENTIINFLSIVRQRLGETEFEGLYKEARTKATQESFA
jgi:hypothetical protein